MYINTMKDTTYKWIGGFIIGSLAGSMAMFLIMGNIILNITK